MVVSERSKNACIFISEETLHRQILRQQKMGSSRFRQKCRRGSLLACWYFEGAVERKFPFALIIGFRFLNWRMR